jgi:hypothetical protein
LVAQAYSPRKKNPDYSSGIIDENAPQQTSAGHEEIQRESGIPDDPFLEEKIYYELKDALGKVIHLFFCQNVIGVLCCFLLQDWYGENETD